jgi:hypothetical protein
MASRDTICSGVGGRNVSWTIRFCFVPGLMGYLLVDARYRYAGAARPRAKGSPNGGNPIKKAAEAAKRIGKYGC